MQAGGRGFDPRRLHHIPFDGNCPSIIAGNLQRYGWSEFHSPGLARLSGKVSAMMSGLSMYPAQVRNPSGEGSDSFRQDRVCWLDGSQDSTPDRLMLACLHRIAEKVSRYCLLPLRSVQGHWAEYPPSGGYVRHSDSFANGHNSRVLSALIYWNGQWSPGDGGELVLHPTESTSVTIAPRAGTCVLFLSEMEHEVLPSSKRRISTAAWFGSDQDSFLSGR